ncbi:MAG: Ig-like domain-containing protein [Vicinamibacteria bacterium]|nr:Ig-like domain-containing protein [Vicinamibacteria bacterium]
MKLAATLLALLPLAFASPAFAADASTLTVRDAAPRGLIEDRDQAREVRVVFSEAMVPLGKADGRGAPWFRIAPSAKGTLRWAGTDTLVFTPEEPLPWGTKYTVTIDGTATAVSGRKLGQPHRFEFTTPVLRLREAQVYRQAGRGDSPAMVGLRFNQPVDGAALLQHAQLAVTFEPYAWAPPALPAATQKAMGPGAVAAYDAKVKAAKAAAAASGPVAVELAAEWDRERLGHGDDLVVLKTTTAPPPGSRLRVTLGAGARGTGGPETPGEPRHETVRLEGAFFVQGFACVASCEPDSWNPLKVRGRARLAQFARHVRVREVLADGKTQELAPRAVEIDPEEEADHDYGTPDWRESVAVTLPQLGYDFAPGRTYEVVLAPGLESFDGQKLGYVWIDRVENWHQRAATSFGGGHGVWESGGGTALPFYARNLKDVRHWAAKVAPDQLVPTLLKLRDKSFAEPPAGAGTVRTLAPVPDVSQSYALELKDVLGGPTGVAWVALRNGTPIPRSHAGSSAVRATLVQVTDLGLTVKDSPQGTLLFVTRLSDGAPVAGAKVALRDLQNAVRWSGETGPDGTAMSPPLALRGDESYWQLAFVATAEKDGDFAYALSDWTEGIEPWYFGTYYDLEQAKPMLRGTAFADRGVYKLGEQVRLKLILRSDTASGMKLLPAGTEAKVTVETSQSDELLAQTVKLGEWSSAELKVDIPAAAPLGNYSVKVEVEGQQRPVYGSFLVAAYRRPDFRVDANLAAEDAVAGAKLAGVVSGRYLFGVPMAEKEARWSLTKRALREPAPAVLERWQPERWAFFAEEDENFRGWDETVAEGDGKLDGDGRLAMAAETDRALGHPHLFTLEGTVTDASRQQIAGRASFRVEAMPYAVAVKRPPFFADVEGGLETEIAAVAADGTAVAGAEVTVSLVQIQWNSVRRAEGGGFYTWETEKREVPAGEWTVKTAATPQPLKVPLPTGGYFELRAKAQDAEGRSTTTTTGFYALGGGYTAWQRYDHNRIDLVPEKKTWKPGETARIVVKSPWETATALLTTEREGIRSRRVFTLDSTQKTIDVPVGEADVPNLFVSLLLVRGRTGEYTPEDSSDPGKPAFRVGLVALQVDDGSKRLDVKVATDREEYRPGAKATVSVAVKDAEGKPAASEVTLWAVDEGVLKLTGYEAPDPRGSVWVEKALQVLTQDSRQYIVSRRAVIPKGGDEGGGGGSDEGGTTVRRDFRVLAFWLGSLPTAADGTASTEVALPEDLTAYRVMAVAGDKASRFGAGQRELRISKPLLLKPAFPRFLTLGDEARFGAVVTSRLKQPGDAIVTFKSLDPGVLVVEGAPTQTVALQPERSREVRFALKAKAAGRARVQMSVRMRDEADAFEETLPVQVVVVPEVVAAHGQAAPESKEALALPKNVVPGYGGLDVSLASTALVGLGEGARYLVEYPYGCAEQRASATLGLVLAAELGGAFAIPGLEPSKLGPAADQGLAELPAYQCDSGHFAYWKGGCRWTNTWLTAYVAHVLQRGKAAGRAVDAGALERALGALERDLTATPADLRLAPANAASLAFAAAVAVTGGRNVDTAVNRLYDARERLPIFGTAHLLDALQAKGESGPRRDDLRRRLGNALRREGGYAHFEEANDADLLWLWSSSARTSAMGLGALSRLDADPKDAAAIARWLLEARKKGRWGNTQENAWALSGLVDYYRKYETVEPDFEALATLAGQAVASGTFQGRSAVAQDSAVPMAQLASRIGAATGEVPLVFSREGQGTLFWSARLRYAEDAAEFAAMQQGFRIERAYAPGKGPAPASPLRSFAAGDLVKVTLTLELPQERRYVAVSDPLPAGFEAVDSWFQTTARDLVRAEESENEESDWREAWRKGGFDHVERHDDRVQLFATRLAAGKHTFTYLARATTAGTFRVGPARVEEMYAPEVFGRSASDTVTVAPPAEPAASR